jgi:hypothetical protein
VSLHHKFCNEGSQVNNKRLRFFSSLYGDVLKNISRLSSK